MAKKEKEIKKLTTEAGKTNFDALGELCERTNKENPKPEDLALLKEAFELAPSIYRANGNTQQQIFNDILKGAFSHSVFFQESASRYVEEMKTKLGYETSSFVEQMLIDEIMMRWLRLQVMESHHKNATYESHTFAKGMYYERRLEMTQKHFLRSIETLAKVRRMIAATQAKGAEMFKNLVEADKAANSGV